MNSEAERTLTNLRVIGAISQNDKLMTNGDHFDIYVPTSMRALMRTWYGERRGTNLQQVRTTLHAAMTIATGYLIDVDELTRGTLPSEQVRLRVDTLAVFHSRMCDALEGSVGGLTNMLQTYREDAALTSQLAGIIQEVQDYLQVHEPYARALRSRRDASRAPARSAALVAPS